ncbi:hypothetical protein Tco_0589266 [Tanacetum coccineum]
MNTSTNIIRDSPSLTYAETGAGSDKINSGGDTEILQINKELGEDVEKQVDLEEKTTELDQDQADLRPSLKFLADEHVILEDPLSSTGTLSSMKNLEDAYAIGDQFINDKSTEDDSGKLNAEAEVVSMVTVPIYQASSSVPLTPPTPQSIPESELAERVTALEKKLSDLEQNNKNLDNTTQNLGFRVYTLELRDLPHKIDEAVRENVKEAKNGLKPILDDERPAPPKPAWVIPTSHIPDAENNWANALASTYQAMVGKTELTQADFEGQAYEVVKAFYPDVVHLQFQMEECHKMLTDQIDWANPEGDQVRIDISRPLPLSGPPGHLTLAASEKDFKKLYPSDFEDLNRLLLQGWDATGYEYKHDYIIIESSRAVVFPVSNNERKIMRFNEIYKFSDGTLINILEALHYKVKEYKVVVPEHPSDTYVFTMKMEILLEPTFQQLHGRSETYTGNLVKEILFKIESIGSSKDGDGDVTPRQGGNARRKQEWISSQHMVSI